MRLMPNLKRLPKDTYSEVDAARPWDQRRPLAQLLDEHIFTGGCCRPPALEFTSSDLLLLSYWNSFGRHASRADSAHASAGITQIVNPYSLLGIGNNFRKAGGRDAAAASLCLGFERTARRPGFGCLRAMQVVGEPHMAQSLRQEYWRPPNPEVVRTGCSPVRFDALCSHCGAEYQAGARFCHICGSDRDPPAAGSVKAPDFCRRLGPGDSPQRLGLSVSCLVFFLIGMVCIGAALLTGLIYRADSLSEWQAIQVWRIEWLLGAAAALLAGILLKKAA